MVEIRKFITEKKRCPYGEWIVTLDPKVAARIAARIDRVQFGNFGDMKPLKGYIRGLCELRLQFGPGYRVYFGRQKEEVVILLCGGGKGNQKQDILRAETYWKEYLERVG